jgi:predicted pyridoxine 5'-phosphate oxidase superfamily flavin-nucleotide-binding protein
MQIPQSVIEFFATQSFVIVSTVDEKGFPHISCKDVIEIQDGGRIFLLDVYRGKTHDNLGRNPLISVTAVNEHKFKGYCLKGRAKLISKEDITPDIVKAWEERIASRLAQRLLKNIHDEKGHKSHPEALLPDPKYMIEIVVEEIIDLTPKHLK